MVNPIDHLNQVRRDQVDNTFTKRDTMAMHMLGGILANASLPAGVNKLELAQLAIQAADILLQELGKPRK